MKEKGEKFFKEALEYVKKNCPDELERIKSPKKPFDVDLKEFLNQYCWVVYTAGFRVKIVEEKFNELRKAFLNFDAEKILENRDSVIKSALKVVRNQRKARGFIKGVELVVKEGFDNFKKRVLEKGIDVLEELPYVGKTTKKHLARNIGFMDVIKDDRWLKRASNLLGFGSVEELGGYIASKFKMKEGVVDFVIWRFCSDKAWGKMGFKSLSHFIKSL